MGFEDYQALVRPTSNARIRRGDVLTTQSVADAMQRRWPEFGPDTPELERLEYPKRPDDLFLIYDGLKGLFQVEVMPAKADRIVVSLRFALCNPRTVYAPFCETISWLMREYDMTCILMRDPAPEQCGDLNEITDPAQIQAALTPGMDYHRRLWQCDAGTDEEARLRPGEAIARFIAPHFLAHATV